MAESKERDLLFDNIKGLLIILVVLGHLLTNRVDEAKWIKDVYCGIYTFHMPAFIFILGYFSKNAEKSREQAVSRFLIPYLFFNTVMGVLDFFLENKGLNFFDFYKITFPRYGMWFLITAFFYKVIAGDLKKMRFSLPLTFALGLVIPLFRDFGSKLALGRLAGFLFFFALGVWFKPEYVEKLRKIPRWVGFVLFLAISYFTVFARDNKLIKKTVLYLKSPYDDGKKVKQFMMRLTVYLIALVFIMALIIMTTRKKIILSQIGANSISVFVFHLFVVKYVSRSDLFKGQTILFFVFSTIMAILLAFIFSRGIFKKAYDGLMGLIIKILYKQDSAVDNKNSEV